MYFKIIFFFLFISFSLLTEAQQLDSTRTDSVKTIINTVPTSKIKKDNRSAVKRLGLGGSTAFWISLNQTHVEVSPMLAYHFPKVVTAGIGYRYIYTRDRFYGENLNTVGPNIFIRAQISKRFYLWSEWEQLKTESVIEVAGVGISTYTSTVHSFFSGIGYIRSVRKNGRGKISAQILYNFLYDREVNSPYYSPVTYRVGYFF